MPMPPPHPVQKVGFMGGIHYHGVHKHEGIKMEELATLLQQVAKNAKAEALQEFQHQKQHDSEASDKEQEQGLALQDILGIVQGLQAKLYEPPNNNPLLRQLVGSVQELRTQQMMAFMAWKSSKG